MSKLRALHLEEEEEELDELTNESSSIKPYRTKDSSTIFINPKNHYPKIGSRGSALIQS